MEKKTPRQPTSVLFPEDLHAIIKEAADSLGIPFSTFIRHAAKERAERVLGKTQTRRAARAA